MRGNNIVSFFLKVGPFSNDYHNIAKNSSLNAVAMDKISELNNIDAIVQGTECLIFLRELYY